MHAGSLRGVAEGRYHVYVKLDGKWVWYFAVEAPDADEAQQRATLFLKPQHRDKPTRLEPETAPGVHKPPQPHA